jgi:hypothetical protein
MSSLSHRETFRLGPFVVPRIWTGLWQLSSNAWGSASVGKVRQGMARHVEMGYTAFGTCLRHVLFFISYNSHYRSSWFYRYGMHAYSMINAERLSDALWF